MSKKPPRSIQLPLFSYKPAKIRRLIKEMPPEERPIIRIEKVGAKGMNNAELLSILLGTKDSLDLAQDILQNVNGLYSLLNVSVGELCLIQGIGRVGAKRILAAIELGRRIMSASPNKLVKIVSPADAANLVTPNMIGLEQEQLVVILLDTRNQVLGTEIVYQGSLNAVSIRVGELFKVAVRINATAVILSHNHPSGDPSPSPEDIRTTRAIIKAGKLLDIEVLDHIIIGCQRYVSMKERSLGFD